MNDVKDGTSCFNKKRSFVSQNSSKTKESFQFFVHKDPNNMSQAHVLVESNLKTGPQCGTIEKINMHSPPSWWLILCTLSTHWSSKITKITHLMG